jgi:hypothetical protein
VVFFVSSPPHLNTYDENYKEYQNRFLNCYDNEIDKIMADLNDYVYFPFPQKEHFDFEGQKWFNESTGSGNTLKKPGNFSVLVLKMLT